MTQGVGVLHWSDWDKFLLRMGLNGHFSTKKIKFFTAASSVRTLRKSLRQNIATEEKTQLQPLPLAQGYPDSSQWGRVLLIHEHIKISKPVWEFKPGISQHKLTAVALSYWCPHKYCITNHTFSMSYIIPDITNVTESISMLSVHLFLPVSFLPSMSKLCLGPALFWCR